MYSCILVAVDLNHEASWHAALPTAAAMARGSGAALHITTVVPDFGSAMVASQFPPDFERKALQDAELHLEKLVGEVLASDQERTLHIEHGSIRTHLLERAKEIGADLIVIASHQPDHVRELLVGSHADWIVRHAPISVLVVRRPD